MDATTTFTPNAISPWEAEVVDRIQESANIFTLRLRLTDPELRRSYCFAPGQFNMLYLFGVGEVAISIVSDPEDDTIINHTIRNVGRVTQGLAQLAVGDRLGLRGPYGQGWPLAACTGNDILLITGGLGCAPLVAVINYILQRRQRFGHFVIIQGVKHAEDLIWRDRYAQWAALPNTQVLLAADHAGALWPGHIGRITEVFDQAKYRPAHTYVMMCGPEIMMRLGAKQLIDRGIAEDRIYLSMERNMHCALGHCGHCQLGPLFICRDGPIFPYPTVKPWLAVRNL